MDRDNRPGEAALARGTQIHRGNRSNARWARSCCHGSTPTDDSITGYQILRGTGRRQSGCHRRRHGIERSTSYTDTAPPAGQTHTYGVKARNAAGLSGPSARPPRPCRKSSSPHGMKTRDNTLVSNLNPTDNVVKRAVVGTHVGFVHERAMSFTTGNNPYGYHLTNSQLYLRDKCRLERIPHRGSPYGTTMRVSLAKPCCTP